MKLAIFDPSTLEEWKQIDADNWQSIACEIIDVFLRSVVTKYRELEDAHRMRNWKQVSEIAHLLKSSCGNVGAARAHFLLNEIDRSAKQKQLTEISHLFNQLEPAFMASLQELIAYRQLLTESQAA